MQIVYLLYKFYKGDNFNNFDTDTELTCGSESHIWRNLSKNGHSQKDQKLISRPIIA